MNSCDLPEGKSVEPVYTDDVFAFVILYQLGPSACL